VKADRAVLGIGITISLWRVLCTQLMQVNLSLYIGVTNMYSWRERKTSCKIPIVPIEILERFSVHGIKDTRFSSCARLLQAIWRERRGLEIGTFITSDGEVRPLGSRISASVARAGYAFLAPDIAKTVRREVAYREVGALIEEQRLWENLLSSQGMTFNLFARTSADRAYATRLFSELFPDLIAEVHNVLFEHSPGRGDGRYLGDYTAFDLFVAGRGRDCAPAFVAIEVKYAEPMGQRGRAGNPRYRELTRACALHVDPESRQILAKPLVQLTAEHLLATTIRNEIGEGARGAFATIAPIGNREAWNAIERYQRSLVEKPEVPFIALSLESIVDAIRKCDDSSLANDLQERYTNFEPVHALIDEWEPFATG